MRELLRQDKSRSVIDVIGCPTAASEQEQQLAILLKLAWMAAVHAMHGFAWLRHDATMTGRRELMAETQKLIGVFLEGSVG